MLSQKGIVASAVVLIISITLYSNAQEVDDDGASGSVQEKIRTLQNEKCELLRQRLEIVKQLSVQGTKSVDEMLDAEFDLLRARLEASQSRAERLKWLRSIVDNRRRMEECRTALLQQGVSGTEEMVIAKVGRVDAQIALFSELPPDAKVKDSE